MNRTKLIPLLHSLPQTNQKAFDNIYSVEFTHQHPVDEKALIRSRKFPFSLPCLLLLVWSNRTEHSNFQTLGRWVFAPTHFTTGQPTLRRES